MYSLEIEISDSDLEQPYNHVHHAQGLRYLEQGRLAYLESRGLDYDAYLASGLFLVVTGINVRYKRELLPGKFTVTCENPKIEGKVVSLAQRILNERGKVCIQGELEFQFLSAAARRSVEPPEEFLKQFV